MSQQTDEVFHHQNFFDEIRQLKERIRVLETAVNPLIQAEGLLVGTPSVVATAEQIRLYRATTLMGQLSHEDDSWLLLNADAGKDIRTPQLLRADGGLAAGDVTPGTNNIGYAGALIAQRSGVDYPGQIVAPLDSPPSPFFGWSGTSANNGLKTLTGLPPDTKMVWGRILVTLSSGAFRLRAQSGVTASFSTSVNCDLNFSCPTNGSNQIYFDLTGTVSSMQMIINAYAI